MDSSENYDPENAGGFIRTHAIRLQEYYRVEKDMLGNIKTKEIL